MSAEYLDIASPGIKLSDTATETGTVTEMGMGTAEMGTPTGEA